MSETESNFPVGGTGSGGGPGANTPIGSSTMDDMPTTPTAAHPTIYPATNTAASSSVDRKSPWRLTAIALSLTLILGVIGGGWLALYFLSDRPAEVSASADDTLPPPVPASRAGEAPKIAGQNPARPALVSTPAASGAIAVNPADAGAMAARVAILEERLARISLTAESASGNAAKAEALLVAFAARRALDRGLPLGAMAAQLRLRFAETQPNAVESILSASANPVTQEALLSRLDALRPALMADAGSGWLTRMGNGISSLITIRSSNAPSPAPTRRFERAQRAIESGRIDDAISEVEQLPGAANEMAQGWINDARRLNDARRSLDLIETAAILEPGQNRANDAGAIAR
jgi:hypothetical protein